MTLLLIPLHFCWLCQHTETTDDGSWEIVVSPNTKKLLKKKKKRTVRRCPIKIARFLNEFLEGTGTNPGNLEQDLTVEELFLNDKDGDKILSDVPVDQ